MKLMNRLNVRDIAVPVRLALTDSLLPQGDLTNQFIALLDFISPPKAANPVFSFCKHFARKWHGALHIAKTPHQLSQKAATLFWYGDCKE